MGHFREMAWFGATAALVGAGGCLHPSPATPDRAPTSAAASLAGSLPPIVGSIESRLLYRLQADIKKDVAPAASVSFIEPGTTARTVATTVTDDEGRFKLDLGSRFTPAQGSIYFLEAFKGLNSNQAGANAIRLRTLVAWQGRWESLSAGGISLSRSTTAIAAAAQINTRQGSPVDLAELLGKLQIGQSDGEMPDTFSPVTNLSVADFRGAWAVVDSALGGNLDPIATIARANGGFYLQAKVGSSGTLGAAPGAGADVGDTVTLTVPASDPLTFSTVPAKNRVTFGGAAAKVTAVAGDGKSLEAIVPDDAARGPIYVVGAGDARGGVVDYPIFGTVRMTVRGIPGSTATVKGSLTPPGGSTQTAQVANPGSTTELVWKGLLPGPGFLVSGEARNAGSQVWAAASEIQTATDSVLRWPLAEPGPYSVRPGLNRWNLDLGIPAIGGRATGSF